MPTLAETLRRFDRKERNWLIRDALGDPHLSEQFRERLQRTLTVRGVDLTIPADAWWAIDFHWNWLFGALAELEKPRCIHENDGAIQPNQEDVDLIVAFDNTVILVEAKATGAWGTEQIKSKLARLGRLRTAASRLHDSHGVRLFFLLTSPVKSERLEIDELWAAHGVSFTWMQLQAPEGGNLLHVTRCDKDGDPDKDGRYWTNRPFLLR